MLQNLDFNYSDLFLMFGQNNHKLPMKLTIKEQKMNVSNNSLSKTVL